MLILKAVTRQLAAFAVPTQIRSRSALCSELQQSCKEGCQLAGVQQCKLSYFLSDTEVRYIPERGAATVVKQSRRVQLARVTSLFSEAKTRYDPDLQATNVVNHKSRYLHSEARKTRPFGYQISHSQSWLGLLAGSACLISAERGTHNILSMIPPVDRRLPAFLQPLVDPTSDRSTWTKFRWAIFQLFAPALFSRKIHSATARTSWLARALP